MTQMASGFLPHYLPLVGGNNETHHRREDFLSSPSRPDVSVCMHRLYRLSPRISLVVVSQRRAAAHVYVETLLPVVQSARFPDLA